jgi:hypothetical protein
MTLSEKIAAKKAAQQAPAPAPGKLRSLVLSNKPAPSPPLQVGFHDERSLSVPSGQTVDVTPLEASLETITWHQAMNSFASNLAITNDPEDPTHSWIAVFPEGVKSLPILLHKLEFREHPLTRRLENQPF